MENQDRLNTHRDRVRASKLRQCMKTLKAAGVTLEELKEYIDKIGYDTPEKQRQAKLSDFRRKKATEIKRVANLTKAREKASAAKEATKVVRTSKGKKIPLDL